MIRIQRGRAYETKQIGIVIPAGDHCLLFAGGGAVCDYFSHDGGATVCDIFNEHLESDDAGAKKCVACKLAKEVI